jgi:hypothetical protein
VAPHQAALAKVFEGKGRTKKSADVVSLLHLWGPEEQVTFKDLQAAIMESMTLAFPNPDKRICVLTNASDSFYAGLVTQIQEEQLDLSMAEQDHQPLAFLSSEFKGEQLRWTLPEKEDSAIVDTGTKVDYVLLSHDEFSILSDHLNLTYIYKSSLCRPYSSAPFCTQISMLGTQGVRVILPHRARDERAQLLDRPHGEMGIRVDSRQKAQSAWQDGHPIRTAVHKPARLRYGEVSVQGVSTTAEERCQ